MSKTTILLIGFFISVFIFDVYAQSYSEHIIQSEVYGTERTISIYLPDMYTEYAPNDSVVVTYLFDAHYGPFREMVFNNINYLSQNLEILSTICVGIHHVDRSGELTPTVNPAENLLARHLEEEVFPFIEKRYRTKPFRIGIGHSRGGMFLMDALSSGNELFNAYIAISPNVGFQNNMIHGKAQNLLKKSGWPKAFVYSSVGSTESNYLEPNKQLHDIFTTDNNGNLKWNYKIYPERSHWGTVVPTIADGLIELRQLVTLQEFELKAMLDRTDKKIVTLVRDFYTDASHWAGFNLSPRADELNEFTYMLINENRLADALEAIDWAIKEYPRNPNLLDSKGDVLERQGNIKKAHAYYANALKMLEAEKDRVSESRYQDLLRTFRTNFERTKE